MPLIRIDAETGAVSGIATLIGALDALPADAPVTVLIHGYKYAPGRDGRCPHRFILSPAPSGSGRIGLSWPHHLGLCEDPGALGIAFGWQATGSLWRAWVEAGRAGAALGRLLAILSRQGRQADILAHSLGGRVVLEALTRAPAGSVRRAILITPAEFRHAAEAAMQSPAGRTAEVINVASRENDLFDLLIEWLIAPHRPGARALGEGLGRDLPNWTDLQIGDAATLRALASLGYPVAPSSRRVCHWSGYLRPGLFPLYRAILSGALPLPLLRASLPDAAARRWPRLVALPERFLPMGQNAPS